MINAKEELLEAYRRQKVAYVYITIGDPFYSETLELYKGTLEEVLPKLENVLYDSGFGIQELFGTIWYTDGTWSERVNTMDQNGGNIERPKILAKTKNIF